MRLSAESVPIHGANISGKYQFFPSTHSRASLGYVHVRVYLKYIHVYETLNSDYNMILTKIEEECQYMFRVVQFHRQEHKASKMSFVNN